MNGKKAKALRRAERLCSPLQPTDDQILAAISEKMDRDGIYVLFIDKDHLDLPVATAVVRVMNRIMDEDLWPSGKICTVQASMDMAMRTRRALTTGTAPPWASMADRFCPEARIFVVMQSRDFPEQFTALVKEWRDPYATPSQTKQM